MKVAAALEDLVTELKRIDCLASVADLLSWDEQVNLPSGSADRRASELKAISDIVHRERTRPRIGEWLDTIEAGIDSLDQANRSIVREARRDYDKAVKVPPEFVAAKSELSSRAYHAWARARRENEFSIFEPFLADQIKMAVEEAAFFDFASEKAYDYHIDKHDPGLSASLIDTLFAELLQELRPLVTTILNSQTKPDLSLFVGFPIKSQNAFLKAVTTCLGFDYNRGRIDVALHPFCGGNGADTRMTTRFSADNPLDSLFSSIHETGHGLYEQGLPQEHFGTALGEAVGMAVHESQSRLWENQVGRSRSFWEFWEPRYRDAFPEQLSGIDSEAFYLAINAVSLNPIRTDSDEVTYNLHIILRFELEKRLLQGGLSTADLPAAWNEASSEIVGLTPSDDSQGVLQDIHWSGGAFGYFPSYCLGNILAAQLWFSAWEQLPDLENDFRRGRFQPLLEWLNLNIHSFGKQYDTLRLTEKVTGRELSPSFLIRYLKERYLPLYS